MYVLLSAKSDHMAVTLQVRSHLSFLSEMQVNYFGTIIYTSFYDFSFLD